MDAVRRRRRQFTARVRTIAAKTTRPDMLKTIVKSIVGSTVAIVCFGIYAIHLGTHAQQAASAPHAFFAAHASKVPAKARAIFDGFWWNLFLYLPTAVSCLTRSSACVNGMARTVITLAGTAITLIFFVKSVDIGLLLAAVCIYVFVSNNNLTIRVSTIGVFAAACATEVIKFKQ